MAISAASIKYYQSTVWEVEDDTEGGVIDLLHEITTATDKNIFDDTTDAERVAGNVEYRKIFIRNENADTWESVLAWIEAQTPATNSVVAINCNNATADDVQLAAKAYNYFEPNSKIHADVQTIGNLVQDASHAIWIRRTITAAGDGYTDDTFEVKCESS